MFQAKTPTSGPISVMIDYEPFMMTASLNVDGGNTTLTLYVSTLIEWDSEILAAAREVIDGNCVRLTEKALREDEGMYQGRAWEYQFMVFDECPVNVTHLCRREVECPTTKICIGR